MRSDTVTKGKQQAPHRSLFHALGMTQEEMDRPLVGIVSSYNEIVPGLSLIHISARHLASLKAIDPMKIFHKTIDYKIYNGDYEVPVRIYLPREKVTEDLPVFLFFHGGGWVTDCCLLYTSRCV